MGLVNISGKVVVKNTGKMFVNVNSEVPNEPASKIVHYNMSNASSYTATSGLYKIVYSLTGNTNASLVGSPTIGVTDCGKYLLFNGTNQYAITQTDISSLFNGTSPDKSESTSVFMWIYPINDGVILSELGTNSISSGWHSSQIEMVENSLKFGMWSDSGLIYLTSSIATPFNNWYHVGFTYNGSTLIAYVNGTQAGQISFNREAPYNNGSGLHYGIALQDSTNMGDGSYGNVRVGSLEIFTGVLTSGQVSENYVNSIGNYNC